MTIFTKNFNPVPQNPLWPKFHKKVTSRKWWSAFRKHMTSHCPQTLREGPETQTEFQSEYIGNLLTGAGSRNVYASNKILCAFQSIDLLLLHQWLVCTLLDRAILKLLMQYNCSLIYVLCAKCLMLCGKKNWIGLH